MVARVYTGQESDFQIWKIFGLW